MSTPQIWGPCVPTPLSLSSTDSSSSGNGMCCSICLTLLVKALSPSLPLSFLSLPVSLSPCLLCLSLSSLILYLPLISSSFLFGYCLDPIIFTSFYCIIFSLRLYCALAVLEVLSCVDIKSSCLGEVTPNSLGGCKASDSPGGPAVKTPCCQCSKVQV